MALSFEKVCGIAVRNVIDSTQVVSALEVARSNLRRWPNKLVKIKRLYFEKKRDLNLSGCDEKPVSVLYFGLRSESRMVSAASCSNLVEQKM